jgi:phosphate uptake regulator
MVEDARTMSSCLDMVFVAKSLERIGDRATNIFEHVISLRNRGIDGAAGRNHRVIRRRYTG